MGEISNQGDRSGGGGERKAPRPAPIALPKNSAGSLGKPPAPGQVLSTPRKSSAPAPQIRSVSGDARSTAATPTRKGDAPARPRPSAGSQAMGQQLIDALASAQQMNAQQSNANFSSSGKKKPGEADPLKFRRTLIPILFTSGFILLLAAAYLLLSGQDSAIVDLFPAWTPYVLLGGAVTAFIAVAVNVFFVRSILG